MGDFHYAINGELAKLLAARGKVLVAFKGKAQPLPSCFPEKNQYCGALARFGTFAMAEITAKAAFQHLKESCLSLYGKTEWDGLGKSIFFFFFLTILA